VRASARLTCSTLDRRARGRPLAQRKPDSLGGHWHPGGANFAWSVVWDGEELPPHDDMWFALSIFSCASLDLWSVTVLHSPSPLGSAQLPTSSLEPQVYLGDAWIYPALFELNGVALRDANFWLVGELATPVVVDFGDLRGCSLMFLVVKFRSNSHDPASS
jgi:hypothetical protein